MPAALIAIASSLLFEAVGTCEQEPHTQQGLVGKRCAIQYTIVLRCGWHKTGGRQ